MVIFFIVGFFILIIPFVPGIIFLLVAFFVRKRTSHKSLPIVLAIIGILLVSAYGGWQWLHPRLESAQAIDVFNGSLASIDNKAYRLINFDVDSNDIWQKGALISMIYETNYLGYTQEIQIDQMNPPQQSVDLKYNVGSSESSYVNCSQGSGQTCQQIGAIQGNNFFYVPPSDSDKTAFAYAKLNNNIIALADFGSIHSLGSNITPSEAREIIVSLKPVSKKWETNVLTLHYNGGIFIFGLPGNAIIPLPA